MVGRQSAPVGLVGIHADQNIVALHLDGKDLHAGRGIMLGRAIGKRERPGMPGTEHAAGLEGSLGQRPSAVRADVVDRRIAAAIVRDADLAALDLKGAQCAIHRQLVYFAKSNQTQGSFPLAVACVHPQS